MCLFSFILLENRTRRKLVGTDGYSYHPFVGPSAYVIVRKHKVYE